MRFPQRLLARVCLLAACLCGFEALAQQLTVAKLVDFIKSAIQQKNADKDVAIFLAKIRLSEKLAPSVVEDLQAAGIGPKTAAALVTLVTQSAALPAPPPKVVTVAPKPAGPPEPSEEEQKQVLQETREYALNYVKSLPNFLCLQLTRRSVDTHFQPGSEGSWSPADRLVEQLTFYEQKEKYTPIQQNETALIGKTWESLGGSISRGDFGSLLGQIFDPNSNTEFRWLRWGTIRGQLTHVYQYRVDQEHSQETVDYMNQQKTTPAYHGLVYVQKGLNVVVRLTIHPDIAPDFPVQDVDQMVDYDFQDIGGQQYLLPSVSTLQMRDGHVASRNEIEWRKYQKYSANTTITFEAGDDKPAADDKKEQPPVR